MESLSWVTVSMVVAGRLSRLIRWRYLAISSSAVVSGVHQRATCGRRSQPWTAGRSSSVSGRRESTQPPYDDCGRASATRTNSRPPPPYAVRRLLAAWLVAHLRIDARRKSHPAVATSGLGLDPGRGGVPRPRIWRG